MRKNPSLSLLFSRPSYLLLLSFSSLRLLFLTSFLFVFIIAAPILFGCEALAQDNVYARNGEVYVMIGEKTRMGVYANQKIDATGKRVTVRPDGVKLFGDPTKMDNYQSIAVDQFRNVYVLAGKFDNGLQVVKNINPAGELYVPVDPPDGCGIAGIGRDAAGNVYYDVLNYLSKDNGADIAHLHGAELFWNETMIWSGRNRAISSDYHPTAGTYGSGRRLGTFINEAKTPPAMTKGFNFVTGQADNFNTNYSAKYTNANPVKIRRMPEDIWYPGDYLTWNNIQYVGGHEGIKFGKMYIHYDFKIQRIYLWISHYVQSVPAGVALPPAITAGSVNDMFEQVFNTTNMKYKFMRHSGCESGHKGDQKETEAGVNTDYKIGFSTTGAGRRYVYSSLPTPKIKKGTIKLVAGNTYGIPQVDSDDYNKLDASQPLKPETCGIGAATKNKDDDFVYTAPITYDGWDVIAFAVADQWDGTGGVRYLLLQAPGAAAKKFDINKAKKLRWDKMKGYAVDGNKGGVIGLKNDVKAIAGDGSGSVYYLTDPRPVFDAAGAGDTFHSAASSPTDIKPLITPGKPDGPFVQDGKNVWMWYRKFSARAATELFQIEYYTKTETKLNDFTVGNEDAIVLETFSDAAGANLISRAQPIVIPPGVKNIKVALATVNLAGPPTGNNEKMCVDIVSSNVAAANAKLKDIKFTGRDAAGFVETKIEGDEIAEDTQYRCYMENAPPKFSDDLIQKNIISGLVLKDENANGIIGGFDYAVRPGTACYYWRVEMIEPHKKPLAPDANFITTTTPARNVTLTKVAAAPAAWTAINDKGARAGAVNLGDGYWYSSRGPNADLAPGAENGLASEAAPDFAFTPKEPGIYKISLIASAKKWNYGVLKYPSYITDRDMVAGCKDGNTHFLFFDNGDNGGTAGDGSKTGGEDYVAERYIVVTAKKTEVDKYITKIKIEGPAVVKENEINTWTASANLKYIRAIEHDNPDKKMETYNGIGVWDYPDTAVVDWGLTHPGNQSPDGGEDYKKGAPARPSNSVKNGANIVMEPKMRNFGEQSASAAPFGAAPPELAGVPASLIFGTPPSFPTWVVGAGTNANPTVALNKADRGAIEYEWYLAAEETGVAKSIFHGAAIDGSVSTLSDPKRFPSILIAKGRLSDERAAGAAGVVWNGYTNANREFSVKVTLRYAFDMPLDPGRYFLYIKFKYPKLKWEGRSEKKDKDGNIKTFDNQPPKPDKSNVIYAYYDLVSDGNGETVYHGDNWETVAGNAQEPAGFVIKVEDKQPPQSYFISDNPDPANPKPDSELAIAAGALPAAGVEYIGGTTGDPYRGVVKYNVCDNNPNRDLDSTLKALTGKSYKDINPDGAWQTVTMTKTDDKHYEFNAAKLKMVLEKTIAPKAAVRPAGQVQDAVNIGVNDYPGYGIDAPYRMAKFQLDNPHTVFTKDKIPYDMTGSIPMYAASVDKAGNTIGDAAMKTQVKQGVPAQWPASNKHFPGAPARISIIDNDAPSLRFYALRTRDNVYREYIINASGAPDAANQNKPGYHAAYNDELDWDPAVSNKLKFSSWGLTKVSVKDSNLDGTQATLTGQNNPVHTLAAMQNNTGMCTQYRPTDNGTDIGVGMVNGKSSYIIKFGGKNVGISETYNKYSPANIAYYEFDKILPAGAGDLLELIEDARSKFEITVVDNVDNIVTVSKPAMVAPNALMAGNCYVDTLNLGDPIMLGEVMNSWKQKGSLVETYGIFRDPTPTGPGALQPSMLIAVKDASGNATVIKLPIIIRHTLFRPNVINVETRRSE